ncbi:hypothetical protein A6302_04499 [Methylobrevis pamukkalensis]|uniref:Uncharacterized protein n=1 Tax=Methylobrevis pamukkalensis TaxID=1439726 RepID=A0A1E3GP02_9HYPH|nr:hypothetical protein A6302_04499 [Methylobrevis pamukkalensis]
MAETWPPPKAVKSMLTASVSLLPSPLPLSFQTAVIVSPIR